MFIPPRPIGDDCEARGLQALWDNAWGTHRKTHRDTPNAKWNYFPDGTDEVIVKPPQYSAGTSGGYMGEYDQTKSYLAGQEFSVAVPTTIAGIQVSAGLYAVPPAGTDGLGTWAGAVPANPTGNAVPQDPLPTITAAPNNVWYARLVAGYCS